MLDAQRRKSLQALGPAILPPMVEGTVALFAGQALRPAPSICSVERDLAYGADARHRLDVFRPASGMVARAIFVYVHGGGFVAGDKGAANAPFYNNIGAWAATQGYIGVTMTYRLAPAGPWPAGSDDVAAAVGWLRVHLPGNLPIFVMGQSAGAVHVAGYLATARYAARGTIAGAMLFSGIYDRTRSERNPMEQAYFGADPARLAEQSTLQGLVGSTIPILYSVAEFDPEAFQKQAGFLVEAHLAAHGALPRMLYFTGHNHISPALQVGGPGDAIGPELANFVERFTA